MADVREKVEQIRQAIYGIEVRESIASGIEAINTEVESTTLACKGVPPTEETHWLPIASKGDQGVPGPCQHWLLETRPLFLRAVRQP